MTHFSYESMGTTWKITIWDELRDEIAEKIQKRIVEMSNEFDQTYSRFIPTSLVSKISEKIDKYEVPEDFMNMLTMYRDLYEASEKKINPLIGFTISDLGYDARYTLMPKEKIRHTPDLFEAVEIVDARHIRTKETVLFDFGALGKGYFVDKIVAYLHAQSIDRFLVDGSGDIYYCAGSKNQKDKQVIQAGLEHPTDSTQVIGTAYMSTGAMCASGINRRKWDKYHHVIDPYTSTSTDEGILATWVIADTTALADALASCLFFVPPESLDRYKFEYVIMNSSHQFKKSAGWQGEFF